jgi:hypothetical protein
MYAQARQRAAITRRRRLLYRVLEFRDPAAVSFIGFCVDLNSVKCSLCESGEQIAGSGVIVPGEE